jgi:hypothetical protein
MVSSADPETGEVSLVFWSLMHIIIFFLDIEVVMVVLYIRRPHLVVSHALYPHICGYICLNANF